MFGPELFHLQKTGNLILLCSIKEIHFCLLSLLKKFAEWLLKCLSFHNRIVDNIYIGFGIKNSLRSYSPSGISRLATEFRLVETEANDPTVEKEKISATKENEKHSDDDIEDYGNQ